MKKRILILLVVLAGLVPAGLFAAGPFDYSATKPGDVNLNAGIGYGWGIALDVGADFIIGKFDITNFPIEWGIGVRGLAGFGFFSGFDWGVAALWTLHKGMSFGDSANFDWYIGIGPGIGGYTGYYWGTPFGIGVATCDGIAWQLTDILWLQLEYVGIYGAGFNGGTVSTSVASIGVRISL